MTEVHRGHSPVGLPFMAVSRYIGASGSAADRKTRMKDFLQLGPRGRILRLRSVASAALTRFDVPVREFRCRYLGANCVFQVRSTDGRCYALRVPHLAGDGPSLANLEMAWIKALRKEGSLPVPSPVTTPSGDLVVSVDMPAAPGARHCVMYDWLPGRLFSLSMDKHRVGAVGSLVARLHAHAITFRHASLSHAEVLDTNSSYAALSEAGSELHVTSLPPAAHALVQRGVTEGREALTRLYAGSLTPHLIHNDIRPENIVVFRGRLQLLDFDCFGLGFAVQDVATTLGFFLEPWLRDGESVPDWRSLRDAFMCGYADERSLPREQADCLNALLAGHVVGWLTHRLRYRDVMDVEGAVARAASQLTELLGD